MATKSTKTTEPAQTMTIITTKKGTLGPEGLTPAGQKATIPVSAFSRNWMRPATAADAALVDEATSPDDTGSAASEDNGGDAGGTTSEDKEAADGAASKDTAATAGSAAANQANGKQTS